MIHSMAMICNLEMTVEGHFPLEILKSILQWINENYSEIVAIMLDACLLIGTMMMQEYHMDY